MSGRTGRAYRSSGAMPPRHGSSSKGRSWVTIAGGLAIVPGIAYAVYKFYYDQEKPKKYICLRIDADKLRWPEKVEEAEESSLNKFEEYVKPCMGITILNPEYKNAYNKNRN